MSVSVVGHSNLVALSLGNDNENKVLLLESSLLIPRGLDGGVTPGKSWTQPIFLGEAGLQPPLETITISVCVVTFFWPSDPNP